MTVYWVWRAVEIFPFPEPNGFTLKWETKIQSFAMRFISIRDGWGDFKTY